MCIRDRNTQGFSWFPGYAVNMETGERLNIFFGENSSDPTNNGNDMLFDPTSIMKGVNDFPLMGGRHFLYIMNSKYQGDNEIDNPHYVELISNSYFPGDAAKRNVFKEVNWVSIPKPLPGTNWLNDEVYVTLQMHRPYDTLSTDQNPENEYRPLYGFSAASIAIPQDEWPEVKLFPNPGNESFVLDKLPENTFIDVYNLEGKLLMSELSSLPRKRINTATWNTGIYLIQLRKDDYLRTFKWIKTE